MQSAGSSGSSLRTQPAAGAAIIAPNPAAVAALASDAAAEDESSGDEGDEEAQPTKRRKKIAIGSAQAIYVDRVDPMSGSVSKIRISRFEFAKSKGLRPSGDNAAHSENIAHSFLLRSLVAEDNAASMKNGRGASTSDMHVQKVIIYYVEVSISPRPSSFCYRRRSLVES